LPVIKMIVIIDSEITLLTKVKNKYIKLFLILIALASVSACKVFKKPCGCNDFGYAPMQDSIETNTAKSLQIAH